MTRGSFERIWILSFIGFLVNASAQMFNPILSIYIYEQLQISLAEVGLFISLFFIASALTKILASFFLIGKWLKRAMLISLIIIVFSPLNYSVATSTAMMALSRLLNGFGNAVLWTLLLTFSTVLVTQSKLSSTLTRVTAVLALGLMLGPIFGALTAFFLGIRNTLLVSAILAAPTPFLALAFARKIKDEEVESKELDYEDFKIILQNRTIVTATLAFFCFDFAFAAMLAYAPLLAKRVFSTAEPIIAVFFFSYYASTFVSRLALTRLKLDKINTSFLIVPLIVTSLGLLTISLSTFAWLFNLGFIFTGFSHGLIFPLTSSLVAKSSPPNSRVLANAIYLTSTDLGAVLGPLVASFVVSNHGIPLALMGSAFAPLCGAGLLLISPKE